MNKFLGDKKAIAVFVLPSMLLFTLFIFVPIGFSVYYSLLDWDGYGEQIFVGLQNYINMFVVEQDFFVLGIKNSLILAALSVFVQLPVALILALIISSKGMKGESFFRNVYFIPVVISTTVLGQLWMRIYHPSNGLLNTILEGIGLDSLTHAWLGDAGTALGAAFVVLIWQYVGYHMLLMYSAIKAIPPDLYEAASIDGTNKLQAATRITLPLIMPMIKVCVTFAVIGSFKTFDLIYVLTKGGPIHATEVPATLMFNTIFLQHHFGYGSSMAIFILIECLVFTVIIQRMFKTENYEY